MKEDQKTTTIDVGPAGVQTSLIMKRAPQPRETWELFNKNSPPEQHKYSKRNLRNFLKNSSGHGFKLRKKIIFKIRSTQKTKNFVWKFRRCWTLQEFFFPLCEISILAVNSYRVTLSCFVSQVQVFSSLKKCC